MKKVLSVLFVLVLFFSISCGNKGDSNDDNNNGSNQGLELNATDFQLMSQVGESVVYNYENLSQNRQATYNGTRNFSGIIATVYYNEIYNTSDSSIVQDFNDYLKEEDNKLKLLRTDEGEIEAIWVLIDFPLYEGKEWIVYSGDGEERTAKVTSVEDVDLPIGVVSNAFKVVYKLNDNNWLNLWYHKDYPFFIKQYWPGDLEYVNLAEIHS